MGEALLSDNLVLIKQSMVFPKWFKYSGGIVQKENVSLRVNQK